MRIIKKATFEPFSILIKAARGIYCSLSVDPLGMIPACCISIASIEIDVAAGRRVSPTLNVVGIIQLHVRGNQDEDLNCEHLI